MGGGDFYDDGAVYERYRRHREWVDNPNRTMEEPAVLQEIGDAAGLHVLDLGCGDAAIGRTLLAAGCANYHGLDASTRMVDAARAMLRGTPGTVECGEIERYRADASFDLVISRLALHYVEDVAPVLGAVHACLRPGGRLVITVPHPVITSHDPRERTDQPRAGWEVDDYFLAGARHQVWLGAPSVWHHRPLESYVAELLGAGFRLTGLRECAPRRERFDDPAEYERRQRIPLFLLLAAERGEAHPAGGSPNSSRQSSSPSTVTSSLCCGSHASRVSSSRVIVTGSSPAAGYGSVPSGR